MVGVNDLASLAMGKRSRRRGEQTEPLEGAEPRDEPAPEGAPGPLRPDGRLR